MTNLMVASNLSRRRQTTPHSLGPSVAKPDLSVTAFYFAGAIIPIAIIYLLTLCPYVGSGDSGEFIVDAYTLAAPHPPGYPLYTFIAHLFTWLPFGSVAWRVNLFSTLTELAASAVLFGFLRSWLGKDWLACVMTLFFSLAPLPWRFSLQAEVFALNNLFVISLLWVLLNYQRTRELKYAYWSCLVLGLASCHHLTILMFAFPIYLYFLVVDWRRLLHPKVFLTCCAIFFACLLIYLSMFYLGQNRSITAWGDFSNWEGFWTHVLRKEYGTFQLANGDKENSTLGPKLYYFMREMVINSVGVGLLVAAVGAFAMWRKSESARLARLVLASLVFFVVVFHTLSNLDLAVSLYYHAQSRMWILPFLLLTMIMAWTLSDISERQPSRFVQPTIAALVVALTTFNVIYHWRVQDQSHNDFFYRFGHSMIDNVEKDAVILMREDVYVNALRYLQTVDHVRPDVGVVPLDAMWWPWMKGLVEKNIPNFIVPGNVLRFVPEPGAFTIKELLLANLGRRPLYVAKLSQYEESTVHGILSGLPSGFHAKIMRDGAAFTYDQIIRELEPFLNLKIPSRDTYLTESWENYVIKNYFEVKIPTADLIARSSGNNPQWLMLVAQILKQVADQSDEYRAKALEKLGTTYAALSSAAPQFRQLAIAAWEEHLRLDPSDSEQNRIVRKSLNDLRAQGASL